MRVETDLRKWAIVLKCFRLLSVLMNFYVMHLLYNGNLVYHINECTCMGAYVLICGDTRCVPGCFNCCCQRIHAFIVPVIPVLCFTKSYLDLVNKNFLFNLVSCLALGS